MVAEFVASTLGAQGANLGLTPSDLAAFQIQQSAAINRATVSGNYADSATPGSTLVPVTIGDAAWVASQNALVGVTSDPTTVTTQEAKITAAEAVTPNNPALITPIPQALTLTTGIDSPTQGFQTGHGATATTAGAIFQADPAAGVLGLNNTLNTGDNLQDTVGDGTLNFTAVLATAGLLANPGYATGVTMNGISTLNTTNQASLLGIGLLPSGFQGNITGLTTVNDGFNGIGSVAGVQLGGPNQGLNTALQTVNINQFAGNPTITGLGILPVFAADIKAGIAAPNLTVNLNGNLGAVSGPLAPGAGGAAIISISSDGPLGTVAAPNTSYVTQTYNTGTNTATYLQLEAQSGGFLGAILAAPSVDGTTNFVFKGGGTLAVGQDVAGDHQLAQNIDASGTTGSVYITGAASGLFTGNAIASIYPADLTFAGPGALFGSQAGFLDNGGDGIFGLTKFELGSGTTYFDASNANAAELALLTTTPGALVALNNEIVVNDGVAATGSLTTFANIKGFEILGVGGAVPGTDGAGASGGTYNMTNLPTFNEIIYQTSDAFGFGVGTGVKIINQAATLTVNIEDNGSGLGDNLTVSTLGGAAETFNLVLGNPLHGAFGGGDLGNVTLTNDNIFNITAAGAGLATDFTGFISLTPTSPGTETVNIGNTTTDGVTSSSTQPLSIGFGQTAGGIADINAVTHLLNPLNLTINDTSSSGVSLNDATTGLLNFTAPGDTAAISYSNNAFVISVTGTGGLITLGGDANFVTSSTVAGSIGDTITGSASGSNMLGGSIGNDAITALSGVNTIYTDGGADTIVLSASGVHSHDVIDLYAGEGAVGPGADIPVIANSITDAANLSQLGWSGLPTGGVATEFGAIGALSGGTSASISLIQTSTGGQAFNPGTDSLGFGVIAWGTGTNGAGGANLGLTNAAAVGGFATLASGAAVSAQVVTPGVVSNAGDTLLAGTNLIELNGSFTGGAAQVADTLVNAASRIFFASALGATNDAHILLAYQNNGSVDIADVTFHAGGAAMGNTAAVTGGTVHISDIVQLTGVSLASFEANATTAVHFV